MPPKIKRTDGEKRKTEVPEGVWTKCPSCGQTLYIQELVKNLNVCPNCQHHMKFGARKRLEWLLDPEGRTEIGSEVQSLDPLSFVDSKKYPDRLKQAKASTGETEALVVMAGTIKNIPVVAAVFEFDFMGGSMGSAVGERFVRGAEEALKRKAAFICYTASGGARMQEGVLSLMQMSKTTAEIAKLGKEKIPFISILTNPTMGGVSASFAFMGDVVMAEPKALIGFAGPRVIEQTVREKLPEGFQRAEFLLSKGAIDMIVPRSEQRETIARVLALLRKEPEDAIKAEKQ